MKFCKLEIFEAGDFIIGKGVYLIIAIKNGKAIWVKQVVSWDDYFKAKNEARNNGCETVLARITNIFGENKWQKKH
jgi:hypothetical protein